MSQWVIPVVSQSVSRLVSQLISQSVNQQVSQSVNKSVSQLPSLWSTCNFHLCDNGGLLSGQSISFLRHRNKTIFCHKQLLLIRTDTKCCEVSTYVRLCKNVVRCFYQWYVCFRQWCVIYCQNSSSEHVMITCTCIARGIQCSSGTISRTI